MRRPAIRFVLDVSNRLARRNRERETVVHVFTFVRQLRRLSTVRDIGRSKARARDLFFYYFFPFLVLLPTNRGFVLLRHCWRRVVLIVYLSGEIDAA